MAARPVHRSQSTPDFFLDASPLTGPPMTFSATLNRPSPTATSLPSGDRPAGHEGGEGGERGGGAAGRGRARERTLSLDGLSPATAVPSFDFGAGIETDLPIESRLSKVQIVATTALAAPPPKMPPVPVAAPQTLAAKGRSKSIVGRPKSWLVNRAASFTESAEIKQKEKEKAKELEKEKAAAVAAQRESKKAAQEKDARDASSNEEALSTRKRLSARDRSSSFRSSSFADFAKKSWISSSRSPSPTRDKERRQAASGDKDKDTNKDTENVDPLVFADRTRLSPHKLTRRRAKSTSPGEGEKAKTGPSESPSSTSRALNRASGYFGKIKPPKPPRIPPVSAAASLGVPLSGSANKSSEAVSPAASTRSVSDNFDPRSSSQTELSATSDSASGGTGSTAITEPPSQAAAENMHAQKPQAARDPLWGTFRRLDSEYAIFLSKTTTAQRILIARNTLIPFLRAHNTQDASLSAEDVDRRATILHKWWNGLLALLEGSGSKSDGAPAKTFAAIHANNPTNSNFAPVSGVDRPGLLELITYIMMRHEWRMCTPSFQPYKADATPGEHAAGSKRASARESSDCVIASAEHNVRTMFVGNLLNQMAIVVERMSGRHAPTSLVTFCGKACAYAFFFVPGIAEVLVRLWGLTPDLLRRVADELGLARRSKSDSQQVVSLFPPTLQNLGWTSVKAMTDNLRLTTKLSLVAAKIQWHGPWISRWRGGDSDLFFIFCKYYYILTDGFVPAEMSMSEKAKAPGFVLVHAQLLSVLDTTIHHRQAAFENMMGPTITDPANGADAMAAALAQLPPSNLLRGMDENRLVALLKDMLASESVGGLTDDARQTFAIGFMSILKAATKRTPVFRQGPVLMLMDFFHEVLLVFDAYAGYTVDPEAENRQLRDHVDWAFWLSVCHKVLFESNSTMSEIRILSFIFAAWDILTADPARKEMFCIGWLLSEEVFDKFFNNYTPMVRAYFMRLLCWRICRDRGSPNELDTRIFTLAADRLKQAWSHYLWLKQNAEATGKLPPSTAPCHPQPGKRFMIVRMEVPPPQTGLIQTGFDTMSHSAVAGHDASPAEASRSENSSGAAATHGELPNNRKKWSILGRMLSFTSSTAPGGPAAVEAAARRNTSSGNDLETARRELAAERSSRPPLPPPKGSHASTESDASSTGSAPVYDTAQFVFKFTLGPLPWNPSMDGNNNNAASAMLSTLPRERPLVRPRLPAPAHARVTMRAASSGSPRSDSPPPPSPGMPAPERMYSGTSQRGLISGARNATPLEEAEGDTTLVPEQQKMSGFDFNFNLPEIQRVASVEPSDASSPSPALSPPATIAAASTPSDENPFFTKPATGTNKQLEVVHHSRGRPDAERHLVQAIQPVGFYRDRATYLGRSLAEWSIVVHECNSFIDRRRDEGVCGLQEVEVPTLGIENLRRMG
ncbi:hypothetical protein BD289DRAFT_486905 [Coniella lustricola]|uniref:Uncharacterized protein n=1 Tax=Coniella lustricola TaxID=2025994 RepID=A0A2T2ZTL8_9PEZI|nr:hypothetical protein BD289DRAFT_486905 [Coniella lustricola]